MPGRTSTSCAVDRQLRHRLLLSIRHQAARQALRVYASMPPLDLGPEVADQALDRPCRRVAERADGVALDLLGHVEQQVDLLEPRRRPCAIRSITRHSQPVPSRQGVHWPQLSCM